MVGYCRTSNDLIDSGALDRLSLCATRVYRRLERLADKWGRCYPGLAKLGQWVGFCVRSVGRAVKELIEVGLIVRHRKGARGKSNVYQVMRVAPEKSSTEPELPLFAACSSRSSTDNLMPRGNRSSAPRVPTTQTQPMKKTQQQGENQHQGSHRHAAAAVFGDAVSDGDGHIRREPLAPEQAAACKALAEAGVDDGKAHELAARSDSAIVHAWIANIAQRKKQPANPAGLVIRMLETGSALPKVIAKTSAVDIEAARKRAEEIRQQAEQQFPTVRRTGDVPNWREALAAGRSAVFENAMAIKRQRQTAFQRVDERDRAGRELVHSLGGAA